jgi:dipeptidyl aminopeptidase/acylaminoacyl peptidase
VRDVYVVGTGGSAPDRLTRGGGVIDRVSWSPRGDRLAAQYTPGVFDDPRHGQIAVIDLETGGLEILTGSLDRNCGTFPQLREPIWDEDDLVFVVEDRGNTHLYRVPADGSGEPERVVGGERSIIGLDAVAGRVVTAESGPTTLAELRVDGRTVAEAGSAFTAAHELVQPQRFTATSEDGSEVDAWVMKPAGFVEGEKYPALLAIHGGPYSQYGSSFFDEFQVYSGAGYVIVFSNPRGSSGYSESWARAIRGRGPGHGWGTVDHEDCMAVMDEAMRRFDFIDEERLGVMGGSYGGYMTSWIVGHTDRFKAAVSERAVNHFVSQWGSSDLGWDLKGYLGTFLFEDVDEYVRMSPATYAAGIDTPLLILHSEDDLRCPIEQGEHLFTTLRLLRKEVELVRFPAESHELTRSGSPVHRVERFEIILEWFDRHLKH